MNTIRLLRHGLKTMTRYGLRSTFMMLGCLLGVAAFTFVMSAGKAAEHKFLTTANRLFSASSIIVSAGGNVLSGGPREDGQRLRLDDLLAISATVPTVEAWDPWHPIDAQVRHGGAARTVRVVGASENTERVWERYVTRGEYFDAASVARAARLAVVGETVVRELFSGEDPLGAELEIAGAPFRVVGVLEAMGTDVHGFDRDNEIVIPISTAMRRLANTDTLRGAKLLAKDPSQVAETGEAIRRILRERHGIAQGQKDDFKVLTAIEIQNALHRGRQVLFVFLPIASGIILLASGIVSAALMLASVSERTNEIGIRRAVGARSRDIVVQFLVETATIALSGGILGTLVGAVATSLVADRLALGFVFSWKAALTGIALAALTGLVAGVLPARRAGAIPPVDALR